MKIRVEVIPEKFLIGNHLKMNLLENKTLELWKSFMPKKKEIVGIKSDYLFSVQIYPLDYFQNFNPANNFEKWAAMEIEENCENKPKDMAQLTIPSGKYAVFEYTGLSNNPAIFHYIFNEWLPKSGFYLDFRPHFEVLGEKYKNNDPDSEEEIWIPII